ncbi:MAG: hypothetical protein ACR2IK_17890 [Chloroflexota bacterium]
MTTTVERAPLVRRAGALVAARVQLSHAAVALPLAAYAVAALIIPTLANVAVTDDWVYYRGVETLLLQHQLRVHEMSSAATVFQTLWGAAFASLFGLSFGVLRVSTVVMVAVGGLAFYALSRELSLSRGWSVLGMAACLFHPLFLSLAYTFMTDPHFVALVLIATWLYVRGLRVAETRAGWVVAGSIVAACSVLVRQQGVLLPAGVLFALAMSGRLSRPLRALRLLLQTSAIPAVTAVAFTVWLREFNGTPWALSLFWSDIATAGWGGVLGLGPRLAVTEALYVGFFVLPIAVACLSRPRRLGQDLRGWARLAALAWATFVSVGAVAFWLGGQRTMPYVGQFVTPTGIGPEDLIAARPVLLELPARGALTVVCVLASILTGVVVAERISATSRFLGSSAGIATGVALGQLAGTVPPSVHFIGWGGTLDRYLLPLLPFAILLLTWAVRRVRVSLPVAWLAVALMGAWAVAGTRDHLMFLDSVWSLAAEANTLGVPNTRLDAGAGWDGFHVYVRPPDPALRPLTPNPPWWTELFAPQTDSSYVVAGAPLAGHAIVLERSYWSALQERWLSLYLLRRSGVQGPP